MVTKIYLTRTRELLEQVTDSLVKPWRPEAAFCTLRISHIFASLYILSRAPKLNPATGLYPPDAPSRETYPGLLFEEYLPRNLNAKHNFAQNKVQSGKIFARFA